MTQRDTTSYSLSLTIYGLFIKYVRIKVMGPLAFILYFYMIKPTIVDTPRHPSITVPSNPQAKLLSDFLPQARQAKRWSETASLSKCTENVPRNTQSNQTTLLWDRYLSPYAWGSQFLFRELPQVQTGYCFALEFSWVAATNLGCPLAAGH